MIRVSTTITRADVLRLRTSRRFTGNGVLTVLVLLATGLTVYNAQFRAQNWWPLIGIWTLFAFSVLYPRIVARLISPKALGTTEYEFRDDGIEQRSSLGRGVLYWSALDAVVRNAGYILLRITWSVAIPIREVDVGSEEDVVALVAYIDERIERARAEAATESDA